MFSKQERGRDLVIFTAHFCCSQGIKDCSLAITSTDLLAKRTNILSHLLHFLSVFAENSQLLCFVSGANLGACHALVST